MRFTVTTALMVVSDNTISTLCVVHFLAVHVT